MARASLPLRSARALGDADFHRIGTYPFRRTHLRFVAVGKVVVSFSQPRVSRLVSFPGTKGGPLVGIRDPGYAGSACFSAFLASIHKAALVQFLSAVGGGVRTERRISSKFRTFADGLHL